jgi:broad specificity phosphatase PhoE
MRWSLGESWESLEEAQRRFVGALERVADDYPGKTAIVVSHGTVMRTFLMYTGYGTLDELVEDVIQNTGYIMVETDGKGFDVREAVGLRYPSVAGGSGRLEE